MQNNDNPTNSGLGKLKQQHLDTISQSKRNLLDPQGRFNNAADAVYSAQENPNFVEDYELGTLKGQVINSLAGGGSGAISGLGALLTAPANARNIARLKSVEDAGFEIYAKYKQDPNSLTLEEHQFLFDPNFKSLVSDDAKPGSYEWEQAQLHYTQPVKQARFDVLEDALGDLGDLSNFREGMNDNALSRGVNRSAQNRITEQVGESYDKNIGNISQGDAGSAVDLIFDMGDAILDNPSALPTIIAESFGEVLGGAGLLSGSTSQAIKVASDRVIKAQEEGELNNDTLNEILTESLIYGGMDFAADKLLVDNLSKAFKKKTKAEPETDVPEAETPAEPVKDTKAFKDRLLGKGIIETGKTAGSTVVEGVTEGIQTAIEEDALGEDFTVEKGRAVAQGVALGAGAGGATRLAGSTGSGINNLRQAAGETVAKGRAQSSDQKDSPEDLEAGSLKTQQNMSEGAKSAVAQKIQQELDEPDSTDIAELSTEGVDASDDYGVSQKISTIAARLKQVDSDSTQGPSAKKEQRVKLLSLANKVNDKATERFDALSAKLDDGTITATEQTELDNLGKSLSKNYKQVRQMIESHNAKTKVEKEVGVIENVEATSEDKSAAAKNILSVGLISPEKVTSTQIKKVLAQKDSLSEADARAFEALAQVKRALAQANQTAQNIKTKQTQDKRKATSNAKRQGTKANTGKFKTTSEVIGLSDKNGNKGGLQYMQEVAFALAQNNKVNTASSLGAFQDFVANRNRKAQLIRQIKDDARNIQKEDRTINAEEQARLQQLKDEYNLTTDNNGWNKLSNTILAETGVLNDMLHSIESSTEAFLGENMGYTSERVSTASNAATTTPQTQAEREATAPRPSTDARLDALLASAQTTTEDSTPADVSEMETMLLSLSKKDDTVSDADTMQDLLDSVKNETDADVKASMTELLESALTSEPTKVDQETRELIKQANSIPEAISALEEKKAEAAATPIQETAPEVLNLREQIQAKRDEINALREEYAQNPEFQKGDGKEAFDAALNEIKTEIKALRKQLAEEESIDPDYDSSKNITENTRAPEWLNKFFSIGGKQSVFRRFGDLVERLKTAPDSLLSFISLDQTSMTPAQQRALAKLGAFIEKHQDDFDTFVPDFPLDLNDKDLLKIDTSIIGVLQDENGQFLPEVKQAMAIAAFMHVTQNSKDAIYRTKKDVAKMLGIQEEQLPYETYKQLVNAGTSRDISVEQMGTTAMNILGLKGNHEVLPENLYSHVQMMLGGYSMTLLTDNQYFSTQTQKIQIDDPENDGEKLVNTNIATVRPVGTPNDNGRLEYENLAAQTVDIIESFDETDGLANALLGKDAFLVEPRLRKARADEFTEGEDINNTRSQSSEKTKEVMRNHSNKPYVINQAVTAITDALPEALRDRMLGVVSEETAESDIHITQRDSEIAKGNAARLDYERFTGFVKRLNRMKRGLSQYFYLDTLQHSQGRFGIKQYLDPQGSKVHRGLVILKEWAHEIPVSKNAPEMTMVKLAIGQGLGVDIDKLSIGTALNKYRETIQQPEIQAGVEALIALQSPDELTASEILAHQIAVTEAVEKGGENLHSLHALENLARITEAQRDPSQKTVTVDVSIEIDGVTNGVFFGASQFPIADINTADGREKVKDIFRRTGVKFDAEDGYGTYIEKGGEDSYNRLKSVWLEAIQEAAGSNKLIAQSFEHISALFPVVRNSTKDALMTFLYGSSTGSIIGRFAKAFENSVYQHLTDVANNRPVKINGVEYVTDTKEGRIEALRLIQKHVQGVIEADGKSSVDLDFVLIGSLENYKELLLNFQFDYSMEREFNKRVFTTFKKPLDNAFKAAYGDFSASRKEYSELMQGAYEVFLKIFNSRLEQRKAEYAKENPDFKPTWELPRSEVDKIFEELRPIVTAVPFMLSEEGEYDSFIQLASESKDVTKTGAKKRPTELQFTRQVGRSVSADGRVSKDNSRDVYQGRTKRFVESILTRIAPLSIHSMDAGTMSAIYASTLAALGVHDGIITSPKDAIKAAKVANESANDTINQINLGEQPALILQRVLDNLDEYTKGDEALKNSLGLTTLLNKAIDYRDKVNAYRDGTLPYIIETNQYFLEDGGHTVAVKENSPYTEIKETEFGLLAPQKVQTKTGDALEWIYNTLNKTMGAPNSAIDLNSLFTHAQLKGKNSNPLTKFLNAGKEDQNLKVFRALQKRIPKGTKIFVITKDTNLNDLDLGDGFTPDGTENGFYDTSTNTVYIKSNDFLNSGMRSETILHETLHVLTADLIEKGLAGELTGSAKTTFDNLQKLYVYAQMHLPADDRSYGMTDLHEFVAEAFSNAEFQEKLKDIKLGKDIRQQLKKVDGATNIMQAFVTSIKNAFFPDSSDKVTTLFDAVINTGSIMTVIDSEAPTAPGKRFFASKPDGMTSTALFKALGELDTKPVSQAFSERLSQMQSTIIQTVLGPEAQLVDLTEESVMDAILTRLAEGTQNRDNYYTAFGLGLQERHVAEQLYLGFSELDEFANERNEVRKLYDAAKAQLESVMPQSQYDIVFNQRGHEDPMLKFFILANASESFGKLLEQVEVQERGNTSNVYKKVMALLNRLFSKMQRLGTGAEAVVGNTNERMKRIAQNMALHHSLQVAQTQARANKQQTMSDKLNNTVKKQGENLRYGIEGILGNKNTIGKMVSSTFALADERGVDSFSNMLNRFSADNKRMRDSFAIKLANEALGKTELNQKFVQLLRKSNMLIDKARKNAGKWTRDAVKDAFGSELLDSQQISITHVLLRNDLESLVGEMGLDGLDKLLSDPSFVKTRIKNLEAQLQKASPKYATYYMNQAEALGLYMQTNVASNYNLAKNAHNIAKLFGTGINPPKNTATAEAIIDELASLHGLRFTDADAKTEVRDLLRKERQRTDVERNGIEQVLLVHKHLKQEFAKNNDKAFARKGFTSQIVNPHLTVEFVVKGSAEHQLKLASGYKEDHEIKDDELDPFGNPMVAMVIEDGGMARRVTGSISYTAKTMMGTRVQDTWNQDGDEMRAGDIDGHNKNLKALMKRDSRHLFTTRKPLNGSERPHIIPSFNKKGKVSEVRYEMSEKYRANMLEKNYRMADVLSSMASSVVDKENTESINKDVINALAEQYNQAPARDRNVYVEISASSLDPTMREYWDLLPKEAKYHANKRFGDNKIMVRREHIDMVFGYKKASITDLYTTDPAQLAAWQKAIKYMIDKTLGKVLGDKLVTALHKGGRAWTEVMGLVKDIIVVRNLFTTIGNIMSNMALLSGSGVPLKNIVRHQTEAWTALNQYEEDERKLYNLVVARKGTSNARKRALIDRQIDELNRAMKTSVIYPLIKEGMLQTIIEDIEDTSNDYSYASKLTRKLDSMTRKLPKAVQNAGDVLVMRQGTSIYKAAYNPISMSDFVARYAQYQHVTTRSHNPMDHATAIEYIEDNFVNYDIPTSKSLQYLNDTGLVMFTKYFIRIQRPILRLMLQNPANVMMMAMMQNIFDFSSPLDSILLVNKDPLSVINNPLMKPVEVPDEIAPINAILHLLGLK